LNHVTRSLATASQEIGEICLFLASPEAAYINGATIWADGGGL
jgi:NAD(P)-dependent dehydrogenase (short-subunit alcohol dehydrogenase family)